MLMTPPVDERVIAFDRHQSREIASATLASVRHQRPIDTADTPREGDDFTSVGVRARELLDAKYANARKAGTRIVFSLDVSGQLLKLPDLTDQELAAIVLNRDKTFTPDEQSTARCEFTERERIALEPFNDAVMHHGDRRGDAIAINYIYSCMTPEVREATRWTPEMISSNNEMLDGDIKRLGPIEEDSVLQALLATARSGRSFNLSPLRQRLFTYGPTAATTRHH
jgi:hypothetical protein